MRNGSDAAVQGHADSEGPDRRVPHQRNAQSVRASNQTRRRIPIYPLRCPPLPLPLLALPLIPAPPALATSSRPSVPRGDYSRCATTTSEPLAFGRCKILGTTSGRRWRSSPRCLPLPSAAFGQSSPSPRLAALAVSLAIAAWIRPRCNYLGRVLGLKTTRGMFGALSTTLPPTFWIQGGQWFIETYYRSPRYRECGTYCDDEIGLRVGRDMR
jgi:hypothetical protein